MAFALFAAADRVIVGGVPVTVTVDGHTEAVRSYRADVGQLLADLGLRLRPEDRVKPAPDTPLRPGLRVSVQRARLGLIHADGATDSLYSHANTLGDLLAEADVQLAEHDALYLDGAEASVQSVLPAPDGGSGEQLFARGRAWTGHDPREVRVSLRRAVPITVDDGSVPYTIFTTAETVGEALVGEELTLYLGDRVQPSLGSRIHAGMRVVVERSTPIIVSADRRTFMTRTRGKTVGDALVELGVIVAGSDRVTPALDQAATDNMRIRLVRVDETTQVERQPIPYQFIMVPDDNLEIDSQRLVQDGREGEYRKRFRVVYEDSVESSRDLLDEWVAARPVTRTVSYGRKIVSRTLDTPDGPLSYWRKVRMYATAYSPARSGTPASAPWYGRTRLGWTLRKGIVAVDPKVVPLQTKLYVPGYGLAQAGDTGGGVRGRWVDLGYEDQDFSNWYWWVDVYILDPPPPPSSVLWVLPNYPTFRDRG